MSQFKSTQRRPLVQMVAVSLSSTSTCMHDETKDRLEMRERWDGVPSLLHLQVRPLFFMPALICHSAAVEALEHSVSNIWQLLSRPCRND
jgi:hypothetical protein